MTTTARRDPEVYLRIYLEDHRGGAVAGERLARRCRDNNIGSDVGRYLATLVEEVRTDAETLDEVMATLGVTANPLKQTLAAASEYVARLKPNGQLRGYSPLSRVVELEGLIAGVHAKQRLWNGLAEARCGVAQSTLDEMIERADGQLEQLEALHRSAAAEAFGGSDEQR